MKVPRVILTLLALWPLAAQSFRVHVVNSITKSPVVGASVALEQERTEQVWGRTDATGVFAGQSHAAGGHLLTVARKGYRMLGGGVIGKMIDLYAGRENDLTVEMMPLGVIAGRIIDQYGDPVPHAIVRTEDKVNSPGNQINYESYSTAETDDRGDYRIANVEPGKHYVVAEYSDTHEQRTSGVRSRYRWPETCGLVLYPDATELEQAEQIDVAAGQTTRLNDLRIRIARPLRISGWIKPPPSEGVAALNLEHVLPLGFATQATFQGGSSEQDGAFELEVLPGRYVLTASDAKTGQVSKPLILDVRDKNIANIELTLSTAFEIAGRFTVDGPERIDFSKLRLDFGGSPTTIASDGTFHTGLPGNRCVYVLQKLPEGWYVKRVLMAGRPITRTQFEIEPGITDMAIVLSPRGARVEVSVEPRAGRLDAVLVALLPESGPVADLPPHAPPGEAGKFVVSSVPPGSYRVFTLSASNMLLVMRPDILLDKYRLLAPLINVSEGERKTIVVPVTNIPE